MKIATLILVLLSNQGYWFGGQEGTLTIRPAAEGGLPAAELSWQLLLDGAVLEKGAIAVPAPAGGEATLRLTPPRTRARVTMRWVYEVRARGEVLGRGEAPIRVFPEDVGTGLAGRVGEKRLLVWERPGGALGKWLEREQVPFTAVDSSAQLATSDPQVVLVGPDVIDDSPFTQAPLAALAESGASVMVFRQAEPQRLMGYALGTPRAPAHLVWRAGHPLLADLTPEDLDSWWPAGADVRVVELPADEAALEIGYYAREVAGTAPAPIDAVLVTRSVGKGRLVWCQIPLGAWGSDPRSRIMLSNAIDYLLTRPQPTPRPSQRPTTRPVEVQPVRSIPIQ